MQVNEGETVVRVKWRVGRAVVREASVIAS